MKSYKIGDLVRYKNIGNSFHNYTGKIDSIGEDYISINNGTSSLIVQTMKNLTEKQLIMINDLESLKNGKYPHQRDIELYGGNWITAKSLEEKGLVEIYRNELDQSWVKLKEVNND